MLFFRPEKIGGNHSNSGDKNGPYVQCKQSFYISPPLIYRGEGPSSGSSLRSSLDLFIFSTPLRAYTVTVVHARGVVKT